MPCATRPGKRASSARARICREAADGAYFLASPGARLALPGPCSHPARSSGGRARRAHSVGDLVYASGASGGWWLARVVWRNSAAGLVGVRWEEDCWDGTFEVVTDSGVVGAGCWTGPPQHAVAAWPIRPPDLACYEVFPGRGGRPDWAEQAVQLFRRHGFVVIRQALGADASSSLLQACLAAEGEIRRLWPNGNRGPRRCSFAFGSRTRSTLHVPAWAALLDCAPLLDVVDRLFPEGGECIAGGGDFVFENSGEYQPLHSDIDVATALDVEFPPPYVSANFAVQKVSSPNGPMRILPGTQTLSGRSRREGVELPIWKGDEPGPWLASKLYPLAPGDLILRDVRVLHGGTPNTSAKTRFLPSVEFASRGLRCPQKSGVPRRDIWPVPPSLPDDLFAGLSPRAQAWCRDLAVERQKLRVGWA